MIYTVGEIAKLLEVAPSTLRYYDKEGVLPFLERSGGGMRMFKDEDFEWLSIIECLKTTGMSIKDIKVFIDWCMEGDSTIDQRLGLIQERHKAVQEQIKDLQKTLALLNYKCWYYETAKEAGTCDIHKNIPDEEVPEAFRQAKHEATIIPV